MPSCVVKNCRNHSGYIKKSQGITFHRFPSANDIWKNDWIQIIRESRNEKNWNPSKSSVICSIHFEDNDLYRTKGGLLRVVAYAVPKKFLLDTSNTQGDQSVVAGSPGDSHMSIVILSESGSGQQIKLEQSTPIAQVSSQMSPPGVGGHFSIQGPTLEQCRSLSTNSPLPDESLTITQSSEVELEDPLALYTSTKRFMKRELMRMRTMTQNQKKKIKILNQKVRRLKVKNKSLKDILKTLQENPSRTCICWRRT